MTVVSRKNMGRWVAGLGGPASMSKLLTAGIEPKSSVKK